MIGLGLGVLLMLVGLFGIVAGLKGNKKIAVSASNGSMAVGGNNVGTMINIKHDSGVIPPKQHSHTLTYAAIAVELAGIGVTFWHAWHLAGK